MERPYLKKSEQEKKKKKRTLDAIEHYAVFLEGHSFPEQFANTQYVGLEKIWQVCMK